MYGLRTVWPVKILDRSLAFFTFNVVHMYFNMHGLSWAKCYGLLLVTRCSLRFILKTNITCYCSNRRRTRCSFCSSSWCGPECCSARSTEARAPSPSSPCSRNISFSGVKPTINPVFFYESIAIYISKEAFSYSKIISLTPSENERYELMKYPVFNMIPVVDKRYNYDMAWNVCCLWDISTSWKCICV